MAPTPANDLLTGVLQAVSRSFYLTLRVLPAAIRSQIGLAYLLARTSDTIADTTVLPPAQRSKALDWFQDRVAGKSLEPPKFGPFISAQADAAERTLLLRCQEILAALDMLGSEDRALVRQVLAIIISGQQLDLQRFASASAERVVALETAADLDDYTYRVAGCVGEFWTRMCLMHLYTSLRLDNSFLLHNGVRFGKGLQLVNILRDLPRDLQAGRCYIPARELAAAKLVPQELVSPHNENPFRPVFDAHLAIADAHLTAGWEYTKALPWRSSRVRLACAWPILIGQDTLRRLRLHPCLHPAQRIKVSRAAVKRIMARSVLLYPLPALWNRLGGRPACPPHRSSGPGGLA